jgi:hypothetical protein
MHARRLAATNMDPQLKHWDLMATTSVYSDASIGYADSLRVLILTTCALPWNKQCLFHCSPVLHMLG